MANTKQPKAKGTSTQAVSGTLATRALYPDERRPNDERVTQYQDAKPTRNTKQYHTTTTSPENMDMECQDDQAVIGSPSERKYPAEFQTVVEGQEWRKNSPRAIIGNNVTISGRAPIAEWSQVNENLKPGDATYRTSEASQIVEGFHKGPIAHTYTDEENRVASRGGLRGDPDHRATYSSPGNIPGHGNHAPYMNRGA
jgi:hypothetical protein